MHIAAIIGGACGPPLALTLLRYVNGALATRAEKLTGTVVAVRPLIYSKDEKKSLDYEKRYSTQELVSQWGQGNAIRALVQTVGVVCGAWAVALS